MMDSSQRSLSNTQEDCERFLKVLERRLETMRLLAEDLRQCPEAVVNLDVLRLERLTARQETLCQELRVLNNDLAGMELTPPISPETQTRVDALRVDFSNLQAEIARLSRVHQALLRRARRSLQVMANLLAFCFPLYQPEEGSGRPGVPHMRK